MKNLTTKITSLSDQKIKIVLESYQVNIENAHDIKVLLRKKHEDLYLKYQPYLNTLYSSVADEFVADLIYATLLQYMINLHLLDLPDDVDIGFFKLVSDNFFWPTQPVFLGNEGDIPLLNSILKYSFDLFIRQEYNNLPAIYYKFQIALANYLVENGVLPPDINIFFPPAKKQQLN